ncbi:MAG: YicC family protein [Gammaproteobacteria bacterium]|nr:YicC family protein [Gammaproteobacteria bacterium]
MTGFASVSRQTPGGALTLELRSVNHRYLDLKLVLPEALRPLEAPLRERLRARFSRGRVEATVRLRFGDGACGRAPAASGEQASSGYRSGAGSHGNAPRFVLDHALALEVAAAARKLSAGGEGNELSVSEALRLLAWPGVMETARPQLDAWTPEFEALCDAAIDALMAARKREGQALAVALSERLQALTAGVERLQTAQGGREPELRSRLEERIEALGIEVDSERVAQEAALLVVRQDVGEELDRLHAHAAELARLLDSDEAVGRRLDFLVQELAREANTLASKAGTLDVNRDALDFKVWIEAMREQVQNVE